MSAPAYSDDQAAVNEADHEEQVALGRCVHPKRLAAAEAHIFKNSDKLITTQPDDTGQESQKMIKAVHAA